MTLVLYLDQVFSDRVNAMSSFLPPGEYTAALARESAFLPWPVTAAVMVLATAVLVRAARGRLEDPEAGRAFLLLGYGLCFVLLTEMIPRIGIAASPFVRNASFLPVFLVVGLWSGVSGLGPVWRWALATVLAVNVVLGVVWWVGIVEGSGITSHAGTAFGQTPRLEALLEVAPAVAEARCAWTDEWVCRLSEPKLGEHGIEFTYPVPDLVSGPCLIGEHPPRPETGIELVLSDGRKGLVCY